MSETSPHCLAVLGQGPTLPAGATVRISRLIVDHLRVLVLPPLDEVIIDSRVPIIRSEGFF